MCIHWRDIRSVAFGAITWILIADVAAGQTAIAIGEVPGFGSVSGAYVDTWYADGILQTITEEETGGNPARRKSRMTHDWIFDIAAGNTVTLYVRAWHTPNVENDDIAFQWSPDGQTFRDLLTVTSTSDPGSYVAGTLPTGIAGTVYVRARDIDRTEGNRSLDTVFVDHIFIESTTGGPPAAPGNLRTMDLSPSAILTSWEDPATNEDGFRVQRRLVGGEWSVAATLPADTTRFEDGALLPATSYEYVVYAFWSGGDSPPSNVAAATTRPVGAYSIELVDDVDAGQVSHDHDPLTGQPGIAYVVNGIIHFAAFDGLDWNVEVVGAGGPLISFAYAPTGIPSIAHITGGVVHFVERIGGAWNAQAIDSINDYGKCISHTHDLIGEPAIAYRKFGHRSEEGLWLARRAGGVWSKEPVDQGPAGLWQSIALDSQGDPGIAYSDMSKRQIDTLKYAHWNGTSWDIEVLESGVFGYGVDASLSYDPLSGHPVICHGFSPRILRWDGAMWELLPLLDGSNGQVIHDPSGRIHVGHYRIEEVPQLWIATWNGFSLEEELVDSRFQYWVFSIALDPVSQQPSLSYRGGMLGIGSVKFASR